MKRDIVSAFIEAVRKFPDNIAVEERNEKQVSYKQLLATSSELSKSLEGKYIGLKFQRSAEFIAALFSVWLTKKVALIIDPDWPVNRTDSVQKQVQPSCILGKEDVTWFEQGEPNAVPMIKALDPAYLIYTSGSTGKPKGALLPHGGLCHVFDAQIEAFRLNSTSRSYWMNGVAFDASLSDIWTVLLSGATLCIDSTIDHKNITSSWETMNITHVDLPPALLPFVKPTSQLKTVIIGGQVTDPSIIRKWCNSTRIVNVYGPTEATICTSFSICDRNWDRALIGKPIPGIGYEISKEGELLITGEGVALNYFGEPELTKSRFSGRTFHTKDKVKLHKDGEIEFLGRLDRQLKIHGRLIHPEEIEKAIGGNCVVFELNSTLAAIVEGENVNLDKLGKTIPNWMIPSSWKFVESLPRNTTGKPDMTKICRMFEEESTHSDDILSDTGKKLFEIFKTTLGKKLSKNDLFQHNGMDSLAVIEVLIEAEKMGLSLTTGSLKKYPTIYQLSKAIDDDQLEEDGKPTEFLLDQIKGLNFQINSPRYSAQKVLLTGATGFFGSALLGHLPEHFEIHCLVRGGQRSRVAKALKKHDLKANFEVIDGDLSELSNMHSLAEEIDTVIHSAANISITATWEELFGTNVLGVRKVLEFLQMGRPKFLHYISTLSVFVDARPLPELCLESDTLDNTKYVYGGYAQTKWMVENLVRRSTEAAIYRLGLMVSNSKTGYRPPGDWFCMFMDTHSFTSKEDKDICCDYTHVDDAADQVSKIIMTQKPETYHISNPKQMTYGQLKEFQKVKTTAETSIEKLALRKGDSPLRVFKTTGTKFSRKNTIAALQNEF